MSMKAVFGKDFPETAHESRVRLGIDEGRNDSKTKGLSKDMYSSISFDLAARTNNLSMMDRFKAGLEITPDSDKDDSYMKR